MFDMIIYFLQVRELVCLPVRLLFDFLLNFVFKARDLKRLDLPFLCIFDPGLLFKIFSTLAHFNR